ncbi:PREDICTED: cyclin-dependent kinase inhibitor 7-like [Camelina sativa]|uniref:Cyclin-dependent kinase inhibitor n=1 Tax=Camelina sativa TaxID=90675 RepID=A0ABM0X228_CAMSA|nr:PREDICTED: cyclin-dependent kinase inhibitor 7-like [Camelina sativa]
MSETKSLIFKRIAEFEGSNIKRIRLEDDDDDDDDDVLRSPTRTLSSSLSSSSLAYSVSDSGGLCSAALSEEEDDDHRSSSISSGCSSGETNEIATNTRLAFLDLEAHQISETETETSTLISNNFRKQGETAEMDSATTERREQRKTEMKKMEKSPTQAELDDFFSAAERFQQKRFTEKYNYDVVNDTPLEGRYQWVTLKP